MFTLTGQLNRRDLSQQFARADLCVQPSLTEGFSHAWLDAMAHGLPVLSSDVGAARSVIVGQGERGWLVPPGEPEALAAALQEVLCTPVDWPALRQRCREYAQDRTLETWSRRIGTLCAKPWHMRMVHGKLERAFCTE